jgi:exopolysaccharide biosynthesis polyprenyl glycosylphosphotransferase
MITHLGLILLAFFLVYHLRSGTDLIPGIQLRIPPLDLTETLIFAGCSALLFLVLGHTNHSYSLEYLKQQKSSLTSNFPVWVMGNACVAYLGFGFLFPGGISRFVVMIGSLVAMLLLLLGEHFFQRWKYHIESKKTIALYGSDRVFLQHIQQNLSQDFPGTISFRELQDFWKSFPLLVILAGTFQTQELEHITDTLRGKNTPLFHIPDNQTLEHTLSSPMRFASLLGWAMTVTPLQGRRKTIKRIFDCWVSALGLLLLAPIFFLIAFFIKRNSKGPVFYTQQRVGLWGKLFRFVKFRSMYVEDCIGEGYGWLDARQKRQALINSDKNTRKGILQKIHDDPRVTLVGRFLRKTSLDELPSLWNVLWGDMSLVWPRPHMPHEVAQYQPRHKRLLTIKPGITGYAQLYGRDSVPFDDEAKLDLWYIQHWSFGLDLYILLATCKVVVGGK